MHAIQGTIEAETADIVLCLPARAENVAVVRHALGGLSDAFALSDALIADIRLAVSEACTNVVVHAYDDAPAAGLLEVEASCEHDEVAIVVRDRGRGIAPRTDSPGLGVGLPLIATLADRLEIANGVDGATEVRMHFALDPPRERGVEPA